MLTIFGWNFEIEERCKGVHFVDLGESFPTSINSIYFQKSASIQPRTSPSKFGVKYSILFNRVLSPQALEEGLGVGSFCLSFFFNRRIQISTSTLENICFENEVNVWHRKAGYRDDVSPLPSWRSGESTQDSIVQTKCMLPQNRRGCQRISSDNQLKTQTIGQRCFGAG